MCLITFGLTFFAVLSVSVEGGMILAALLFITQGDSDDDGRGDHRRLCT